MSLRETLSRYWFTFQQGLQGLFPWLAEECSPLGEHYKQQVQVLELVQMEQLPPGEPAGPGRPLDDRDALGRAFLANRKKRIEERAAEAGQAS